MSHSKRVPVLVDTLSVRLPHEVFMHLVAASKQQRRTLSEFVRLLFEDYQQKQQQGFDRRL
jgi:hypothetical protein